MTHSEGIGHEMRLSCMISLLAEPSVRLVSTKANGLAFLGNVLSSHVLER